LRVEPGERLIFDTPGGGGFGPPSKRMPEARAKDISQGLVSRDAAADIYGETDD
jgi:N-methylhydantoinase B